MNLPHRDRSVALAVVGGLEILAGLGLLALCGISTLVVSLSPEAKAAMGGQAGSLWLSLGLYGVAGLAAIVLGAGLLGCRRWARTLSLIAAAGLAVMGLLLAAVYALLGPTMFESIAAQPGATDMPAGLITGLAIAFALGALFVPGAACAAVLAGEDARLTCEWRDRQERWTDRCPPALLALSLMHAVAVPVVLVSAFTTPALVGGRILTGGASAAFYVAVAVVMGAVAAGLYRRRAWAWWADVVLFAAGFLNGLTLLRSAALPEFYRNMGLPEDQVALSAKLLGSVPMMILMALGVILMAAWLLLVRKHFRRPTA